MNSELFNNENNLVLMTMLTIKTYLQLISLKKKLFAQSTIYKSCHVGSCSFGLKKFISIKKQ